MRTLILLAAGLTSLCLASCATTTASEGSVDLELVRLGVKHLTEQRRVEGAIQHRDEAETNGQLWSYAGRLEDKSELDDGDKLRIRSFVDDAIDAVARSRQEPCAWYDARCRWKRAHPED